MHPTDQIIFQKLKTEFSPIELDVQNESHMHGGNALDSHYKVIVVSALFESKRLLARHRMINACLTTELENQVHALAIHTYTESEWKQADNKAPLSPNCLGGSQ